MVRLAMVQLTDDGWPVELNPQVIHQAQLPYDVEISQSFIKCLTMQGLLKCHCYLAMATLMLPNIQGSFTAAQGASSLKLLVT